MLHRDEVFSTLPSATINSALTADLAGQMLREHIDNPLESVSSKHKCYREDLTQKIKERKKQERKEGNKECESSEKKNKEKNNILNGIIPCESQLRVRRIHKGLLSRTKHVSSSLPPTPSPAEANLPIIAVPHCLYGDLAKEQVEA